jgi:HEAT repeat protein
MEALGDEFEPVRLNAAYGLAAMGEEGSGKLLEALVSEDRKVSMAAAYGLSASGESAVDGLLRLLGSKSEETVNLAAFALGELRHLAGKAVPGLVRLTGHSSVEIRRTAVEALGRIQSPEHDDSIITALAGKLQDGDYQVRFWAGLALAKKGPAAAAAVPELVRALDDDNRYVRGHAAEALRRIGTPESTSLLLDYLFASRWCSITTTQNEWYP